MSPEDLAAVSPEESDGLLAVAASKVGLFAHLRERALFLQPCTAQAREEPQGEADVWGETEVRLLWGEQSFWEVPWGVWGLRSIVEEAEGLGRPVRKFEIVQVKGANHFVSILALLSLTFTDAIDFHRAAASLG